MTELLEIYRCEICGNIIQILHSGNGDPVCCGKPMVKMELKTNEEGISEKHVPYFINDKIQVGYVIHPMTPEHHIEFIEAISEDKKEVQIKFLGINEPPEMYIGNNTQLNCAIEYCNLHGLWKGVK